MVYNPKKLIIVSDLDGTLLPPSKIPLERDLAAIRRFEAAGGKFAIATGRTIQAAIRYQTMLGLQNPMIVYNGAAIYDSVQDKVLFSECLPEAALEMTREIMEAYPEVGVEVLRAETAYVVRNTEWEKHHIALCGVEPVYCTLDEIPKDGWLKVLFAMSPAEIPPFIEAIGKMDYHEVDFIQSADIFYEMLPKHVTKGSALAPYRQLVGMRDAQIVAVGDYDNDLELLRQADYSAAPANAVESVRQTAGMVLTRTCEEGAMEELISRILGDCADCETKNGTQVPEK